MRRALLGIVSLFILPSPLLAASVHVGDDGHTRIPFEVLGGLVWVQGTVNGTDSAWVVIDTGASASGMDAGFAKHLGLKTHGSSVTRGSGGGQPSSNVSDVTLQVADISARFETLNSTDFSSINPKGRHPMQFVLGSELFEACVVRFDYPAGMIDVWDNTHAPQTSSGGQVPLTFIDHHPYVDGILTLPGQEPVRGRFEIDTGSNAGLIFAPQESERKRAILAFPRTLEVVSRGVGGESRNRLGRGESFSVGGVRFDKPVIMIPDSTEGTFNSAGTMGNIGGQLLGRCRVTFDYAHHTVGFEPGEGFDRPFETDMSGLALTRDPEGLRVRAVNPATPASEAGMKVGDVLTRIDGKAATDLGPVVLRTLLQQDGRKLQIEFHRGNDIKSATLTLRRLI